VRAAVSVRVTDRGCVRYQIGMLDAFDSRLAHLHESIAPIHALTKRLTTASDSTSTWAHVPMCVLCLCVCMQTPAYKRVCALAWAVRSLSLSVSLCAACVPVCA
jgi:hypothetical protein